MNRHIPSLTFLLLALGLIQPSPLTAAGTCKAYGFENLKTLLNDVTKCPDPKAPGRFYIELRQNSLIDAPLVIPAKTTLRGNLLSDPGKPTALESNFNPDTNYQSGFNMFKQGKTPPPTCLVTLSDESTLANIHLTKVYAKNGICAGSNSTIVNVEVQGPDLDVKGPFVGVRVSGEKNKFSGLVISANQGTPIAYNKLKNQYTSKFVADIDALLYGSVSPKATPPDNAPQGNTPQSNAPQSNVPENKEQQPSSDNKPPAAVDINKQLLCPTGQVVLPNGVCGVAEKTNPSITPQPGTLGPLQPPVAHPASGGGSCSLTRTTTAVSPILAFLAIITLTGIIAYRSQPQKVRATKPRRRHG